MAVPLKILTTLIALLVLFKVPSTSGYKICQHDFMRAEGCFLDKEVQRALPELILYERLTIDWPNWKTWLPNFVCRCAELVKSRGYKTFAVQFYGECWSGPEPSASQGYDIHGLADVSHDNFCTNLDFQKCQSDNEYCSGGAWTMSVYVLAPTECPSCPIKFKTEGCYCDKENRALDHLLMTDRDPNSPVWSGISIDWGNWKTYLPQLACRCAAKAAENGFTVFGIQFYGECWAGNGDYSKYGSLGSECVGDNYQNCGRFDRHCAGEQWSNMVYKIVPNKCDLHFEKIGCYEDKHGSTRPLPDLKLSDRETSIQASSGQLINWRNWDVYLPDFACRCAHKAKESGFNTFGVQFYGECWTGNDADMTYSIDGPSKNCINQCGEQCKAFNKFCAGKGLTNFVYMLKHPCEVSVKPIGCFKDSKDDRQLRHLILSERDPTSDAFEGNMIDWDNWEQWFPQFLCRCARAAKVRGYQMVGLQFHGECWSDADAPRRYNGLGSTDKCFRHGNETCTSSEPSICTGGQETNYVFELLPLPQQPASQKRNEITFSDEVRMLQPVADAVKNRFIRLHKNGEE